ncbi:MAG: hypothetical protein ACJ8J0_26255 [Longimicrobiaceae bacterium]
MLFFAAFGLVFGLLLSALATLVWVFGGVLALDFEGTSYGGVIAMFLIAPTLGGLLAALLFPLTRWRWGAAIVGFVGMVPMYTGAAMVVGEMNVVGILVCALGTGGGLGLMWNSWMEEE